MARVQVLTNSVCLLQLQADHDKTAIGCLMQVSAFTFDTFQLDFVADSYLYVQCMFYPNSDESKVEFVHVCRSRHEEATMIIVDDWYEFDYQNLRFFGFHSSAAAFANAFGRYLRVPAFRLQMAVSRGACSLWS